MRSHVACQLSYIEWTNKECSWVLWAVNLSLNPQKTRFVKKTDTQYYKVQSNNPYFVFHSKTPRNFSTKNKCTNHLVVCPATACEILVWKYNLPAHYRSAHPKLIIRTNNFVKGERKRHRTLDCMMALDFKFLA